MATYGNHWPSPSTIYHTQLNRQQTGFVLLFQEKGGIRCNTPCISVFYIIDQRDAYILYLYLYIYLNIYLFYLKIY